MGYYSTLLLAATTRLSRCHGSVKRLLQRSVFLVLGSATAVTFGAPAQAEVLTALSFDLDESRASQVMATQELSQPTVDSLDGVAYVAASTGVAKSYAGHPAIAADGIDPSGIDQKSSSSSVLTAPGDSVAMAPSTSPGPKSSTDPIPAQWWDEGSDSPIAVAIGNAEGTRQPDGTKNSAYYWHQDPGNGADNFGTFSYQHFPFERTSAVRAEASVTAKREVAAAQSLPEIADQEQMQRLRGFYRQLQHQAQEHGLVLTPLEILNGLDLINQSEAAGLSEGGYIDRLVKMRSLEDDVEEQIKEARSWSYWHPERQAWDAPGLGNGYQNVRRDQDRRFEAVKRAMEEYIPNGKVLVAQLPNSVQSQSQEDRQDWVSEENLLAAAARVTQADALSFGLSQVAAMTGFGQ